MSDYAVRNPMEIEDLTGVEGIEGRFKPTGGDGELVADRWPQGDG